MDINFVPYPQLTTQRLILRKPEPTDVEFIFKLRTDAKVNEYIDRPPTTSIEQAEKLIDMLIANINNKQSAYWIIATKQGKVAAGTICLWNLDEKEEKAELGYELLPEMQGKGFMNEALHAVINYGFEVMKTKKIVAFTHPENKDSIKLLLKNNFIGANHVNEKEGKYILHNPL